MPLGKAIPCFVGLWATLLAVTAQGQDLSALGQKPSLRVSGSLSANGTHHLASPRSGQTPGSFGRAPFNYYLSGNLNFSVHGWSVPLSFSYSDRQFGYTQPFNQYGLHPTYKWLTGHVGWSAMNFSSYTLAGISFLGVGLEAAPTNSPWRVSLLYGRLQKAVGLDTSQLASPPAYRRMGYGAKVGYEAKHYQVAAIGFRARDVVHSLDGGQPFGDHRWLGQMLDSSGIFPEENTVLSGSGQASPWQGLRVQAEYAASAWTRDALAAGSAGAGAFRPFMRFRSSTSVGAALRSSVNYSFKASSIGLGYERVDGNYRTLGAYYTNNDFENLTINATQGLLGGRVNLSGNVGYQRDDLRGRKLSQQWRLVGSGQANVQVSERWQGQLSYSSFTSYLHIKPQLRELQLTPYDRPDTLRFTQVSQQGGLGLNCVVSNGETHKSVLQMNGSFQRAGGQQPNAGPKSWFWNGSSSYSLSWPKRGMSWAASLTWSDYQQAASRSQSLSPNVSWSQKFWQQRIQHQLSLGYSLGISGAGRQGAAYSRGSWGYVWQKRHTLQLATAGTRQGAARRGQAPLPGRGGRWEMTTSLGYNYRF